MKKLLINNNQMGKDARGIRRYFDSLAPYLQNDFEMEMLFSDQPTGVIRRKVREQVFFLKRKQYDILWSPSHASGPYWAPRHVVTVHDLISQHPESGVSDTYRIYFKNSVGLLLKNCSHIICYTAVVADMVQILYGIKSNKISMIPNGYTAAPKIARLSDPKISSEKKFVLFVGTFGAHKNLQRLIEAFAEYKKMKKDDLELVLAGNFPNTMSLGKSTLDVEGLKEYGITFCNNPDDDALNALYSNCHGVVMPSLIEGFGLPITEALDHRKPVIASDINVFKELFSGMVRSFFNPYDKASIINSLSLLSNSSDTLTSSEQEAYDKARLWDWQACANQYRIVFESL